MPTATAITPSTVVTTVSWVGALGLARSRSQAAPAESTMRAATTRGSRQTVRQRIVASSKVQNDADGDAARDRRVREVHPARHAVLREEIDFGIQAAIARPGDQVAACESEIDGLRAELPDPRLVKP